jgi:hypothetical protein
LKKLAIMATALVALLATATVAFAQIAPLAVTVNGAVTPSKGGTKKKPKNAKVKLAFNANAESRTTVQQMVFYIPKDIKLSGKGFKTCTSQQINSAGPSDSVCPKAAKLGSGTASAVLSANGQVLNFTTQVYAAGKNEIALYLQGSGGNQVNVSFPGPITKASGPYGQKITVNIPPTVQQPLAGLYSYITSVDTTLGGKATKGKGKKKKTYYFASLTGCTGGKHQSGVQLISVPNGASAGGTSGIFTDTASCKK